MRSDSERVLIFAYGLLLKGESEHSLVAKAEFVGEVRTKPAFTLVDLGVYPALVVGGSTAVLGELYGMDKQTRFVLDVRHQCPVLFQRVSIELECGSVVDTYAMRDEQVRGKRRLKYGDWRTRFAPRLPELLKSRRLDRGGAG